MGLGAGAPFFAAIRKSEKRRSAMTPPRLEPDLSTCLDLPQVVRAGGGGLVEEDWHTRVYDGPQGGRAQVGPDAYPHGVEGPAQQFRQAAVLGGYLGGEGRDRVQVRLVRYGADVDGLDLGELVPD